MTVTGRKKAVGRSPAGDAAAGVMVAVWCRSVGSSWTLELHELDRDTGTALGRIRDWVSSGVPISQPAPSEALARALLSERGLQLFGGPSAGSVTRTRQGIGYVRPVTRTSAAHLMTPSQTGGSPEPESCTSTGESMTRIHVVDEPDFGRAAQSHHRTGYEHLDSLFAEKTELGPEDPRWALLRKRLIEGHRSLAEHIARRFAGRGEPLEDLVQVATTGLIKAVDRFEPTRGTAFLSFAIPTITGEIRRYFRDYGWSTRVPRRLKDQLIVINGALGELCQQLGRAPRPSEIADHLGLPVSEVTDALWAREAYRSSSLDELLDAEGETATLGQLGDLDAELALVEDRENLRPLLAQLAPRDRTILVLRFFHQFTQSQIAEKVGISQMQVSRVLRRTLTFLHQHMSSSE